MNEEEEFCLQDHDQDAVLQDYREALNCNQRRTGNLHMFFSPNRIPVGLTDDEARYCAIYLYPLKKALLEQQRRKIKDAFGNTYADSLTRVRQLVVIYSNTEVKMPREFSPEKLMTREMFREGVRKFFEMTLTLLPLDS